MRKGNKKLQQLKHHVRREHNKQQKLLAEQSEPSNDKSEIKAEVTQHHQIVLKNYVAVGNVITFCCLFCDLLLVVFFDHDNPFLSIFWLVITNLILVMSLTVSIYCWRKS